MANGYSGRGRHSAYAPLVLSDREARDMVAIAEQRSEVREAVEVYVGKPWGELSHGDKVNALLEADRMARAAGAMAAGMRAWRQLREETLQARPQVPEEDTIELLREQVGILTEQNAELREKLAEMSPPEENGVL